MSVVTQALLTLFYSVHGGDQKKVRRVNTATAIAAAATAGMDW